MYDRHTEHGITEDEEITWAWLCLALGATDALDRLELWKRAGTP